jgi:hypothetical protein
MQAMARAWAHVVLLGVGQFLLQVRDLQVGVAQPRVQLRGVVVPVVLPGRLRPCSSGNAAQAHCQRKYHAVFESQLHMSNGACME